MGDRQVVRIGPYELRAPLAEGEGRQVHLAGDASGRRLVVKLLVTPEAQEQGLAELQLLGVVHPGAATPLDAGRLPGERHLYLVTEQVLGQPLAPGALAPGADRALLAARLLAALAVVHDRGLLHRDVKDDNVLLEQESGRPILLDFGLCRPAAAPGELGGTPRALAPELFRGAATTVASDLWAAGLVLAEAILGRRLFVAEGAEAMAAERAAWTGLSPADAAALASRPLVALLDRLLDPDPAARPADARAALAALPLEDEARRDELWREELAGARTAALAAADPRATAQRDALAAGAAWLDLFPTAETGLRGALERLAQLAASVAQPDPVLRVRLARAADERPPEPRDFEPLAEALGRLGALVLAVDPFAARDEEQAACRRALAARLARIPGCRVFEVPPPAPLQSLAVLRAWLGRRPPLEERLAAAPPRSWSELDGALAELLHGAVSADASGVRLVESRLPSSWPAEAVRQELPSLDEGEGALLAALAHASRPLSARELEAVLGQDAPARVAALAARGLLAVTRGEDGPRFRPADERLCHAAAACLDLPAAARGALARCLAGVEADPDEASAASVARLLGAEAGGQDDPALSEVVLRCADVLRRRGRLEPAAALLRRGLAGAAARSPHLRRLHLDRVDVLTRAARFDDALEALREARSQLGVDGEGALVVREARVHHLTGRLREGLALLESLDLDALSPDDALLGLQERSDLLRQLGRLDEAGADLREALRRQGSGSHRRAMTLLDRLGSVETALGEHEAAIRHFEQAIGMARELGQEALVWGFLFRIGRALRTQGERRRGLGLQEEAARLCEAAGDKAGLVDVLNSLGAGWLTLGRVDTARRHLVRALRVARELDLAATLPMVLNNLGRAFAAEGRLEEAEESFAESLLLRRGRDDRRGVAAVALTRGIVRAERGRLDEAAQDLALARSCLEGVQAPDWEVEADLLEARLALAAGRPQAAQEAAVAAGERAARAQLGREAVVAADLLARAGGGDLESAALEQGERGPWLADLLVTRAGQRVEAAREEAAEADFSTAQSILGETPAAEVEARLLACRAAFDLGRIERALGQGAPDWSRLGALTARTSRDLERAQALVAVHDLAPLRRELEGLASRWRALDFGEDMAGLAPLAEKLRDLERLVEINKQLNTEHDTQKLLDLIIDAAIELTGAARGFLILFEGKAEEFRTARNIDESTIADPQFQISHSVARRVARTGEPLLTANAIDDPRLASAASISKLKLLSIVCVPLSSRGRVLGAVYLDHPQVVGRFQAAHQATVSALAEQAAIAIENARLSTGLERTNQQLRASREEIERLNEALKRRLSEREAELEETKASLDASQRALGLRYDYSSIITRSRRMHEVLDLMDRVTDTDFPVVIYGESGTGKELIARALHFNGPRKEKNFLSLNCAAIAEPLIESELFGSVRGAFTGADRDRKGLFSQAHQGTLFLDEIGDMTLSVQKRLLRVLQEGEFIPVGGREVVKVDVRILCATHRDLGSMVAEGSFREDLYYRLAVGRIELPPLRERPEDIALLMPHFLARHDADPLPIDPEALAILEAQPWPGNVRELENFAMNLLLFERESQRVTVDLVRRVLGRGAPDGRWPEGSPDQEPDEAGASLRARRDAFERRIVAETLARCGGNKAAAARELGLGVRGLYKLLERLGLED